MLNWINFDFNFTDQRDPFNPGEAQTIDHPHLAVPNSGQEIEIVRSPPAAQLLGEGRANSAPIVIGEGAQNLPDNISHSVSE